MKYAYKEYMYQYCMACRNIFILVLFSFNDIMELQIILCSNHVTH